MGPGSFDDRTQLNGQPNEMKDKFITALRHLDPNALSNLRLVSRELRDLVAENDYRTFIKTDEQKTHFKLIQDFKACLRAGKDINAAVELFLQLLREPLANQIHREGVALPGHIVEKLYISEENYWSGSDDVFSFDHLVENIVKQGPKKIHALASSMLSTHKDVDIRVQSTIRLELKVMTDKECLALPRKANINMYHLPAITGGADYNVLVAVRTYTYRPSLGPESTYLVLFHQHQTEGQWGDWGLPHRDPGAVIFQLPDVLRELLVHVFTPHEGAKQIRVLRTAFTDCAL